MKKLMFAMLLLTGCAKTDPQFFSKEVTMTDGKDGVNGTNGSNGHSAAVSTVPADSTACSTGGWVLNLGVDTNDNGLLEVSEITSVAVLCNGATGSQGQQGVAGQNGTNGTNAQLPQYIPVLAITPCGPNSSSYKEVLLGLVGGTILSEFTGNASNAATVRNTLIQDGSYYDTDDSQCFFTITTASNGDRTVSWNGTSNNHSGTPYHAGSAFYKASTAQWTATY